MKNSSEKITALVFSAILVITAFALEPGWKDVGIRTDCHTFQRLVYHFFHVSPLHAAINAWCFLSVVFIYNVTWMEIIVASAIASLAPDFVLSATPTVGLSAICFALLGLISLRTARKLYFIACIALCIAIGFLFPSVNGLLHLYSYLAGLLVGLFICPICRKK